VGSVDREISVKEICSKIDVRYFKKIPKFVYKENKDKS
jgi:hypothetical protein